MSLNKPDLEFEKSFRKSRSLTPAEAQQQLRMKLLLSSKRQTALEYLLRMASLSTTKAGKIGWRSLVALFVFVEHKGRFPRQKELYDYLHRVLDESSILEHLDLPPISFETVKMSQEASRQMVLEEQVALPLAQQRMTLAAEKISSLAQECGLTHSTFLLEGVPNLSHQQIQDRLLQIEKLLRVDRDQPLPR